MVIKIALCDTDVETYEIFSRFLRTHTMMQSNDTDYKLTYFNNSKKLLEAPFDYDILFIETRLETDENGVRADGIEIGKQLREKGNRAIFILYTDNALRYADGYSATVFRYILKPLDQQGFDRLISEIFEFWQNDDKLLLINYNKQTDYIKINDIIMIENYQKKRMIHTESQVFYVKESWESLEKRIYNDGRFFKPQRGYLINFMYVFNNTKTLLTMKNGAVIPFKRGYYKLYREKIEDYLQKFR